MVHRFIGMVEKMAYIVDGLMAIFAIAWDDSAAFFLFEELT